VDVYNVVFSFVDLAEARAFQAEQQAQGWESVIVTGDGDEVEED
jgi:hypothetical protein